MPGDTKRGAPAEAKVRWTPETLEAAIRERVRDTIEGVLEEELEAALGAGRSTEWHSQTLPRHQRLMARVDEAILGVYLAIGNSRRIRGASAPLLRGGPLSKGPRRAWLGGWRRISRPGGNVTWPTIRSATCCSTAGTPRFGSASAGCPCW